MKKHTKLKDLLDRLDNDYIDVFFYDENNNTFDISTLTEEQFDNITHYDVDTEIETTDDGRIEKYLEIFIDSTKLNTK